MASKTHDKLTKLVELGKQLDDVKSKKYWLQQSHKFAEAQAREVEAQNIRHKMVKLVKKIKRRKPS